MNRGRYYGKAASATTAAGHAEDSQPNESINKRKQVAPPRVVTAPLPRKGNMAWRGGHPGRGGISSWPQTAIRGSKSWRGGRGGSSSRGGQWPSGNYPSDSGKGGIGRPFQTSSQFTTFTTTVSTPHALSTSNSSPEHTMDYFTQQFSTQHRTQLPSVPQAATQQPRSHPPLPRKALSFSRNLEQPYRPQFERHPSPPPANQMAVSDELQTREKQTLSSSQATSDLPPLKRRKLDIEDEILVKEESEEEMPPPKPKPPLPKRFTRSRSATSSSSSVSSTQTQTPHPLSFAKQDPPTPKIKDEPCSPSPPPTPPARRLITESCSFFPLPDNCRKSYPGHHQNRRSLFRAKNSWLAGLGLKKTKVLFRDDGMVVEWTSSIPVWSDTLLPEAPSLAMVIQSAHKENSLSPDKLLKGKHASEAALATQESRKSLPRVAPPKDQPKPSQRKFNPVPIPRRKPQALAPELSQVIKQGNVCTASPEPKVKAKDDDEGRTIVVHLQVGQHDEKSADFVPGASDNYSPQVYEEEDHTTEVVDTEVPSRSLSVDELHCHFAAKQEDKSRSTSEDVVMQTLFPSEGRDSQHLTPVPDSKIGKDLGWEEVSTVWAELDTVALAFIDRYIRTFDSDRSMLDMAYTKDAIFSARIHTPSYRMVNFVPFVSTSRLLTSITTRKQFGRAQIINYLSTLGPHQFCPRGTMRNIAYTLMLHNGLILMTVHGEVVNPNDEDPELDHVLSLDQSFVLRKPREGGEDRNQEPWPLEVLSHQMTVREVPLLSLERMEEVLPWVAGINPVNVGGGDDGGVVVVVDDDDDRDDL